MRRGIRNSRRSLRGSSPTRANRIDHSLGAESEALARIIQDYDLPLATGRTLIEAAYMSDPGVPESYKQHVNFLLVESHLKSSSHMQEQLRKVK